jgi:hypothetical protein
MMSLQLSRAKQNLEEQRLEKRLAFPCVSFAPKKSGTWGMIGDKPPLLPRYWKSRYPLNVDEGKSPRPRRDCLAFHQGSNQNQEDFNGARFGQNS